MMLGEGASAKLSAWLLLVFQSVITIGVAGGLMVLFKVPELEPAVRRITRLVRRG